MARSRARSKSKRSRRSRYSSRCCFYQREPVQDGRVNALEHEIQRLHRIIAEQNSGRGAGGLITSLLIARAGVGTFEVEVRDPAPFLVGSVIQIGDERRLVTGRGQHGSLLLDQSLVTEHGAHTTVMLVEKTHWSAKKQAALNAAAHIDKAARTSGGSGDSQVQRVLSAWQGKRAKPPVQPPPVQPPPVQPPPVQPPPVQPPPVQPPPVQPPPVPPPEHDAVVAQLRARIRTCEFELEEARQRLSASGASGSEKLEKEVEELQNTLFRVTGVPPAWKFANDPNAYEIAKAQLEKYNTDDAAFGVYYNSLPALFNLIKTETDLSPDNPAVKTLISVMKDAFKSAGVNIKSTLEKPIPEMAQELADQFRTILVNNTSGALQQTFRTIPITPQKIGDVTSLAEAVTEYFAKQKDRFRGYMKQTPRYKEIIANAFTNMLARLEAEKEINIAAVHWLFTCTGYVKRKPIEFMREWKAVYQSPPKTVDELTAMYNTFLTTVMQYQRQPNRLHSVNADKLFTALQQITPTDASQFAPVLQQTTAPKGSPKGAVPPFDAAVKQFETQRLKLALMQDAPLLLRQYFNRDNAGVDDVSALSETDVQDRQVTVDGDLRTLLYAKQYTTYANQVVDTNYYKTLSRVEARALLYLISQPAYRELNQSKLHAVELDEVRTALVTQMDNTAVPMLPVPLTQLHWVVGPFANTFDDKTKLYPSASVVVTEAPPPTTIKPAVVAAWKPRPPRRAASSASPAPPPPVPAQPAQAGLLAAIRGARAPPPVPPPVPAPPMDLQAQLRQRIAGRLITGGSRAKEEQQVRKYAKYVDRVMRGKMRLDQFQHMVAKLYA